LPAVQLAKLKLEIERLLDSFGSPAEFKHSLDDLLEFYSDRVYRAGQTVTFRPLTPTRHVPRLVMQQLELALRPYCEAYAAAAFALADVLWPNPYLENRHLAIFILGQCAIDPPLPLMERLQEWAKPDVPTEIADLLFSLGTARLRKENPALWLNVIQSWLESPDLERQRLGLQALLPLVDDSSFYNLPPIFRMITAFMHNPQPMLLPGLGSLLEALIRRSPAETHFFLRQILGSPTPPLTVRLIRRLIPLFSPESQASLRKMMLVRS
jgi:hypothetical protein